MNPPSEPARDIPTVRRRAVVLGGIGLGAAGCSSKDDKEPTMEELRARPVFAEAEKRYLELLAKAAVAISAVSPNLRWNGHPVQDKTAACGFRDTPMGMGQDSTYVLSDGKYFGAKGAISDADWPSAVAALEKVAAPYGFGAAYTIFGAPGDHTAALYGPYDEHLSFGTRMNTILTIYGACFLTSKPSA